MARRPLPSSVVAAGASGAAAPPVSPTAMVAVLVVVVGALYLGSEILIPLALAILLSFMLAPIVDPAAPLGSGSDTSVLAVVLLLFVALLGVGSIVASQVVDLAEQPADLRVESAHQDPRSAHRGAERRHRRAHLGHAARSRARSCEEATKRRRARRGPGSAPEVEAGQARAGAGPAAAATPSQTLREVGGPLVAPIATAGLVVVFVIFMLLQREDLRDRVLRLVGASDVARATEAMDDAAKRISRYLLMQLIINVLYGIPVGIGLYFIGVPNPILWGCLRRCCASSPISGR